MSQLLKNTITLTLVLIIGSCSTDNSGEIETGPKTIYEILASEVNYTTLTNALEITGLDDVLNGNETYTLYAPNNSAFSLFLSSQGLNSLSDIPVNDLKKLLLNHVMVDAMFYRDFKTGYYETAASFINGGNMRNISMHVKQVNMLVTLNGSSTITQGNVVAANGIIHIVDKIIALPTVVTFIQADPNLNNLLSAVTRADLTTDFVTILNANISENTLAPFTVFAPENRAFIDLLLELGVQEFSDIDEPTLNATLNYHVISKTNAQSASLSDNLELNTLGGVITANVSGGATLKDGNNRISKITAVDVQANNGIIHIIDKVILPN